MRVHALPGTKQGDVTRSMNVSNPKPRSHMKEMKQIQIYRNIRPLPTLAMNQETSLQKRRLIVSNPKPSKEIKGVMKKKTRRNRDWYRACK